MFASLKSKIFGFYKSEPLLAVLFVCGIIMALVIGGIVISKRLPALDTQKVQPKESPTPTPTEEPTPTPEEDLTDDRQVSPVPTKRLIIPTRTPTPTSKPVLTATPTPTSGPTNTPTPTQPSSTPTYTPTPSVTDTLTPSPTQP